MSEYLYLIKCNEYYKIGIAGKMEGRIAALQTGNPYTLILATCFEFNNAEPVEKSLHQKYIPEKERGEWFKLSQYQVDELRDICLLLGGKEELGSRAVQDVFEQEDGADEDFIESLMELADTGGKWDYSQMFSEGWRMEPVENNKGECRYWRWSRGSNKERKNTYGGRMIDLPYPIPEMRQIYGKK